MSDLIESKDSLAFKRLQWQCRRGMLELDLLLEPFLDEVFLSLDEADRQRFYRLLECEDQEIFPWFMQKEVPEDVDLARIVSLIVNRVQPENYSAQILCSSSGTVAADCRRSDFSCGNAFLLLSRSLVGACGY